MFCNRNYMIDKFMTSKSWNNRFNTSKSWNNRSMTSKSWNNIKIFMLDHGLKKFTICKLIIAYKHQRKNTYLCYQILISIKQTNYIYFLPKSRWGLPGFQFILNLVLKSPLLLCKFDCTANALIAE
jgi:hypothetical protein